jgi:hypothetical protein
MSDTISRYFMQIYLEDNGIEINDYNAMQICLGVNERSICWDEVRLNGLALRYKSDKLKDDSSIVFAAVSQNGLALQFASQEMKDKDFIVEKALNQNLSAIQWVSPRIRQSRQIFENILKYASETGQDPSFALEFLGHRYRKGLE